MQVIDAKWEVRNLGVTCIEIGIGKNDSSADIERILDERNEQYQVAKVGVGNIGALITLQKRGFQFIETLFETEIFLDKRPDDPSICKKFVQYAGYHAATKDEVIDAIRRVRQGDMFSTDRVSLDPVFSSKLAAQRYAYWAEDTMLKPNATMFIIEYMGENVGFNILVDKGSFCDGMLGGLFSEYISKGFGFTVPFASINAAYDLGAKKMISHVSSNNFQMYKLHLLYGMHVKRMTYTMVKHC